MSVAKIVSSFDNERYRLSSLKLLQKVFVIVDLKSLVGAIYVQADMGGCLMLTGTFIAISQLAAARVQLT
jgi:hypothetical protein